MTTEQKIKLEHLELQIVISSIELTQMEYKYKIFLETYSEMLKDNFDAILHQKARINDLQSERENIKNECGL